MKSIYFILTFLFFIVLTYCQKKNSLVDTKWVAENKMMNRTDTLTFNNEDSFTLFDCETSWHYDGKYRVSGDSIFLEIILQQLEVDNYQDLEPTAFLILINHNDYLKLEFLGHKQDGEIEEVAEETYDIIGNYEKLKQ